MACRVVRVPFIAYFVPFITYFVPSIIGNVPFITYFVPLMQRSFMMENDKNEDQGCKITCRMDRSMDGTK